MPLTKKQPNKPLTAWGDRLKAMQDGAKAAMENYNPSAFVQVPDGIYIAKVTCELNETKSGKLRINRRFTILEGEQTNLSIFDGLVIEDNDTGLHIARRWIELHGYEWPEEDMSQLEIIINELNVAAPVVKIRSKSTESSDGTKTFTNVMVSQVLDGYDAEATQQDSNEAAIADDANNSDPNAQIDPSAVEDDEERSALLVLAASHGIDDVNDSMSKDDIAAALSAWQFNDDEITADENALLESIGLAGNIVRKPKPVKKVVTQNMPKAPAKIPARVPLKKK